VNLGADPWVGLDGDNPTSLCGCIYTKEQPMIRKPTPQEKVQAILDARKPVAEYLVSIGKIEAFNEFSSDEICGLIRAAQEAVQASLHKQGAEGFGVNDDLNDEIPF